MSKNIVDRIIAGTATDLDVKAHTVVEAFRLVEEGDKRNCDPEVTGRPCHRRHCHHGVRSWVMSQYRHARVLNEEMIEMIEDQRKG